MGSDAPWAGVHLCARSSASLDRLERFAGEVLAPLRCNVVVFELNYGFEYVSHPECRGDAPWSKQEIRRMVKSCMGSGIRVIPQFNCLGHQSWSTATFALLKAHPDFEEPPELPPEQDKQFYCRSWCPHHPEVNGVVFPLLDELIDAFESDAFHVGMDEVFVLGSSKCPRCRGKDRGELFARAVNDLHGHLVGRRGQTMLMWGDRLLDGKVTGHGKWEGSENDTASAINAVPRDIVLCDWHYGEREDYPSARIFANEGFRFWPSTWKDRKCIERFAAVAKRDGGGKCLGMLSTTWVGADLLAQHAFADGEEKAKAPENVRLAYEAIPVCLQQAWSFAGG